MHPTALENPLIHWCYTTGVLLYKGTRIYLFWIGAHYLSSHLYTYYCTDWSLKGFLLSPINAMTPHCRALSWLQHSSVVSIENMWIVFATWLTLKIVPRVPLPQISNNETKTKTKIQENEA